MSLTPMMQQYQDAKARHPGMLLLFRMGDFYELFDGDAELGARVLGLTLTSRDKTVPMAGFPHHQLESYLRTLLHTGHRVAICEQVEDPATAKGLVKREVTRVVTPGTVTEENLLEPSRPNHLAAVWPIGDRIGLAWVELTTGHFQAADLTEARLGDELGRLAVAECLVPESALERCSARLQTLLPELTISPRPDWTFDAETSRAALFTHFGTRTLAGFGFDDEQPCVQAAGAVLLYLKETIRTGLSHVRKLLPFRRDEVLLLDEVTRRSLELTRTMRDGGRQGSLLSILDRTVTPMGARLLHDWLQAPLTDQSMIDSRLEAVAECMAQHDTRRDLHKSLADGFDLQRLTARVSTGRASPRDLAAVAATLRVLPMVKARLGERTAGLLRDLDCRLELCSDLLHNLEAALVDEPPLNPREGGVIRRGYDSQLDEWQAIAHGGKEWIARFQAQEITRTGINSLKIGFNKVFGYYLEITNTHAHKIPADYLRKQTLKNAERYITPELKEYEEKVLSAEEKIHEREYELFVSLRELVATETGCLLQNAEVLAEIDVLAALAEVATARGFCRPTLTAEPFLDLVAGRHPVLDQTLPAGTVVPNDVHLGDDNGRLWLITGPNMSGKSTFIRQVALLTIMAQMGSFVPATSARVGIADRIFTRVGASDELARGQSTFMVEMTEAANILNNATPRSLVILDEIGRGTSTYDGVSLAWAITEYLHDRVGCRALFATHYHELAQLAETLPGLRNYNVLVSEDHDEIVFLHKITAGNADKSYGIHVARLAGVPAAVLQRAEQVLEELERQRLAAPDEPAEPVLEPRPGPRRMSREATPSLFANSEDPVLAELKEIELSGLDGPAALALLRRWQRELGG